jgi:hypothetical protein
VVVVDALEVVEIEHDHGKRRGMALRLGRFARQEFLQEAPVEQLGQWIRKRLFLQVLHKPLDGLSPGPLSRRSAGALSSTLCIRVSISSCSTGFATKSRAPASSACILWCTWAVITITAGIRLSSSALSASIG